MSLVTRISLCTLLALAAIPVGAANLYVGSAFNVKVIASSTGAPCESNCWERWQETTGLGIIMVEKDASGAVIEAGRISDAYFHDLYFSTDEAVRKNFATSKQILRYGTVRNVVEGCSVRCVLTVDFGYTKDVILGLNAVGKIGGAHAIDDAVLLPTGVDDVPVGNTQCANRAPNCAVWLGAGSLLGISVQVWVIYDEYGTVIAIIIKSGAGEIRIDIV